MLKLTFIKLSYNIKLLTIKLYVSYNNNNLQARTAVSDNLFSLNILYPTVNEGDQKRTTAKSESSVIKLRDYTIERIVICKEH